LQEKSFKKIFNGMFFSFSLGGKNLRGEGIITDNSTRRRGDRKGIGLGRLAPRLLREVRPDQAPLFPSPTRPDGDRGETLFMKIKTPKRPFSIERGRDEGNAVK